jgi:zinc transporter
LYHYETWRPGNNELEDDPVTDRENGLLYAFLLDGSGAASQLDWQGIRDWKAEDGVLWVHMDYSEPHVADWLSEESGLDEIAVGALLSEVTRPRCDRIDGGVLISLRGINHDPASTAEDMVAIRLYVDQHRIISTRQRKLLSAGDVASSLQAGTGPCDAGDLVVMLSERLIARMSDVITELEEGMDELEEKLIDTSELSVRGELLTLRRQTIMLRRYLGPQREALNRLYSEPLKWLTEGYRLSLRETIDRLTRYLEDLDTVRERAAVAYEEINSRVSDQSNRRMYLLSIIAGIFLPLSFITGLLGINVGGIPLGEDPLGFGIVVVLLLFTAAGELLYFWRKNWI